MKKRTSHSTPSLESASKHTQPTDRAYVYYRNLVCWWSQIVTMWGMRPSDKNLTRFDGNNLGLWRSLANLRQILRAPWWSRGAAIPRSTWSAPHVIILNYVSCRDMRRTIHFALHLIFYEYMEPIFQRQVSQDAAFKQSRLREGKTLWAGVYVYATNFRPDSLTLT